MQGAQLRSPGSISGQETKIPHGARRSQNKQSMNPGIQEILKDSNSVDKIYTIKKT